MKKVMRFTGLLAAIVMMVACASVPSTPPAPAVPPIKPGEKAGVGGADWQQRWNTVVEAAKREGSVTIYSTAGTDARKEVEQGMREKFGINIEFVAGRGAEVAQRAITEKRAGINLVDAFVVGSTVIISSLKPNKIVAPIEPSLILPEVRDPKLWVGEQIPFAEKDRMGINISASFDTYVSFNTDLIKEGEITSYRDLLNPKYKGKIAMFDPVISGSGQAAIGHIDYVLGGEQGKNFIRDLAKQEPVISSNYRQLAEWLARGKYAIAIGSRVEETMEFRRLGAPIALVRPREGGKIGSAGGSLALAEKPAHPDGMVVFVNWILSKEGGTRFQKGFANPSGRIDVSKAEGDPYVVRAGEKFYIENEDTIDLKTATAEFSKGVFGPLMK